MAKLVAMRALALVLCLAACSSVTPPVRVIDGDTIALGEERVRIENLDAPERGSRAKCAYEADLAERATATLEALVYAPGARVTLDRNEKRPKDQYDRTLARVLVNGNDVADVLIGAGVARPWRGKSSEWCKPL